MVICFLLAYGAYLGLNALARLTVLLCIIFGLLVLINTVWLIGDMQISRLLPIAPVSLPDFNSVSQKIIGCQFVLLPFIIFYLPHIKEKKQIYPTMIKGVLLAMAYYLLITLRNVLVFGDLLLIDNYPALRALRMIRWGGINYLEFPGVLMMLALIFCGGILLWW
ncbi:MAG: GerAB/ArcD/ProY family transporter, partial [Clostridiales bacterium]